MPNNQTVVISSFGADELGRSGTTGFVDTRFAERFGSAALISLISATPSVAANQTEDEIAEDVLEDIGDDLADATDSVIGEYLSIGPVIYVDQGARITVIESSGGSRSSGMSALPPGALVSIAAAMPDRSMLSATSANAPAFLGSTTTS